MQMVLYWSLIFATFSFLLTFLVPESPRYLYARGKYDEWRKTFSAIASVNQAEMELDYLFDKEFEAIQTKSQQNEPS